MVVEEQEVLAVAAAAAGGGGAEQVAIHYGRVKGWDGCVRVRVSMCSKSMTACGIVSTLAAFRERGAWLDGGGGG